MTNKLLENLDHISKLPHLSEEDSVAIHNLYEMLSYCEERIVIKEEYFHIVGYKVGVLFAALYNMLSTPVYVDLGSREIAFEDYINNCDDAE